MQNIADEFPLEDGLIYLNHAAVGVWPRRTAEAVQAFATENMWSGGKHYNKWQATEHELRQRVQRLINAPDVDDIAFLKNTSEGLSVIAYGLDWQAGDNVVSTDQEFPSNRIVWESLNTKGVTLKLADINSENPEDAIIALMDEHTRLLSVSSVQYATGFRLDLVKLGKACKEKGIFFCVDAIQSIGAVVFDVQDIQADAVIADAHKWLLSPEGIAIFYVNAAWRDKLQLNQFGWHMVEQYGNFDQKRWEPAKSARRFEPGSPNMLGIHALNATLSLFETLGKQTIENQVLKHTQNIMQHIENKQDWQLITPNLPERYAGITSFRHLGLTAQEHALIVQRLAEQNIVCSCRAGGIRLSPHFYTDESDIEKALLMLAKEVTKLK